MPGRPFYVAFGVLLAALLLLGFYVASRYARDEGTGFAFWVWGLGLLALVIVLPSLVQYLVLRRLGATPHRVKWGERGNALFFVTWWRAPHHRFTRGQFAAAYCVPGAILCAIALVYVYTAPETAPVLAFVLPFHLGNFWFTSLVLRAPEGTLAEPFERGLRLYGQPVLASRSGDTGGPDGYASG